MKTFSGLIRSVGEGDLPDIRAILSQWPEDHTYTLAAIYDSLSGGNDWKYLVAQNAAGEVVGVMGLATSGIDPDLIIDAKKSAEMVSAYVAPEFQGTGAGSALAEAVEKMAVEAGFDRLLVISGSRNRELGYPFWRRRYGEPLRVDEDFFAPGAERVVWAKELDKRG